MLRYDSSKLATTHAICEFGSICIGNFPKISPKKDMFFVTHLPLLDLENWFSGYDQPSRWQKIPRKRIFENLFLFQILSPFQEEKFYFQLFLGLKRAKNPENGKLSKIRFLIIFTILRASHSQKTSSLGPKVAEEL